MVINTNVSALFAENALNQTSNVMQTLQQELSTGYRINSPADNPAGLAIANLMSGELGGINSAIQNAQQATNLLQTANGGIQNDMQIVQQIQQLAVEAANGTQTTQDQQDIQSQINNLLSQLNANAQSINYNSLTLLSGSFGATASVTTTASGLSAATLGPDGGAAAPGVYSVAMALTTSSTADVITVTNASGTVVAQATVTATTATSFTLQLVGGTAYSTSVVAASTSTSLDGSLVLTLDPGAMTSAAATAAITITAASTPLTFQVGPAQGSQDVVQATLGQFTAGALGLSSMSVVGSSNAQYAITLAQNALSMLTNAQGAIGSQLDELNYTISNLQTESMNLQSAKSTIMDANMATVTAQFAQEQVLQQTGLQALSSAEQLPGMVLKLLG